MQMLHSGIAEPAIVHPQHLPIFVSTETKHEATLMAYYNDVTRRSDLIERILTSAGRYLATAAERRAKHRVYKATIRELDMLSNRELADLGMHRSELKRVAWEAATNTAH